MDVLANVPETLKSSVEAIDSISGEISTNLRTTISEKVPDDPAKTMGLIENLQVGIGVQYELCVNINVEDGMQMVLLVLFSFWISGWKTHLDVASFGLCLKTNQQESFGVKNMLIYIMRTFHLTGHLF